MTDMSGNYVLIFTGEGGLIHRFGSVGAGRGEFIVPSGIAVNSENRIIVASWSTDYCIQLF